MPSNDESFFKIFRDKHGSIIIGLILKRLNIILLASDSRLTFKDGSVMLYDDKNEYRCDKIFDGKYFAMAMCGQTEFFLELALDIVKSPVVHSSDGLRDSIIEKMNTKASSLPEKKRMVRANCGALVAMFDYKGDDKPIPRLMGIELEARKSGLKFRKSSYGRYNFDGDHYDELKKFLRIHYRPWLSLERGIALIRKCINIVKGTSIRSGHDTVDGYMSVWDISPATPQERRDGTLFHFNERNFDQQIVPEEAPTYPPRRPRCVKRRR